MRIVCFKKVISVLLVILLMFISFAPAMAADNTRAARISDFSGTVKVLKGGGEKEFKAFKGMSLTEGDRITTGGDSWVMLEIDDDKEVKLGENTQINLSELRGSIAKQDDRTGISLFAGKIWTNIKKALNVRSKYEIKTPTTVMGVRGTQFFVGQEDGATDIAVLSGTVGATTYRPVQQPDGTSQQQEVEVVLNQNQQVTLDETVQSQGDVHVEEVTTETLDLFVLETIRDNPEGIDQSLLEGIDQVIEERQLEEQQQEESQEQQGNNQSNDTEPPVVVYEPDEIPANGTGNNGNNNPPPVQQEVVIAPIADREIETYGSGDVNLSVSPAGAAITVQTSSEEISAPASVYAYYEAGKIYFNSTSMTGSTIVTINAQKAGYISSSTSFKVTVIDTLLYGVSAVPGDTAGTCKIANLPELPYNGATKYMYLISSENPAVPELNSTFSGDIYVFSQEIEAVSGQYFLLAAVDQSDRVRAYCKIQLTPEMIKTAETPSGPTTVSIRLKAITRVSVSTSGEQGTDSSYDDPGISISKTGRFVAFSSYAKNLAPGDNLSYMDIFVRDRDKDNNGIFDEINGVSTVRVSVSSTGAPANNGSCDPYMTPDGRFVVFESSASNLVAGDGNSSPDIFVHDRDTDKDGIFDEPGAISTVRVNVASDGTQTSYGTYSIWPMLSDDGRYVVFQSDSGNLVGRGTNGTNVAFVHDRDTDGNGIYDESGKTSTARVDISLTGQAAVQASYIQSISGNGRYVAFNTYPDSGLGFPSDGIYIRDIIAGKTVWAVSGNDPVFSQDGRYMAFDSSSISLLSPGVDTNNCTDIFVMDRDVDADGIFDEQGATGIERINLSNTGAQSNYGCYGESISSDGRYVSYYSEASNLVDGDDNSENDVFIHDRVTDYTRRVSTSLTGVDGNDGSDIQDLSDDGNCVAFYSEATNLITGDTNGKKDAYVASLVLNTPADTVKPSVPGNLDLEEAGRDWLKLTWNPSTDNLLVTGYDIYRRTGEDGSYEKIARVESPNCSYWDTNVEQGITYYYYVVAADEDGNLSDISNAVTDSPGNPESYLRVNKAAAGKYHSLTVDEYSYVWSWGDNNDGQLGDSSSTPSNKPVAVKSPDGTGYLGGISVVQATDKYSAALKNDGTVWMWGDNYYGQFGRGVKRTTHLLPVQVKGLNGVGNLTNIVDIASGECHMLALDRDGTVWAWGYNGDGELGDGTDDDRYTPARVKGPDGKGFLTGIVAISAGYGHNLALDKDGNVWVWGQNSYYELGLGSGDTKDRLLPVKNTLISGVGAVAAGYSHSMVLKVNDGSVWTWGYNGYCELGNNSYANSSTPVQVLKSGEVVTPLLNVSAISAGYNHSMAVMADGTLYAWGDNDYGQLGIGSTQNKSIAQPVLGENGTGYLTGISNVTGGESHTVAIASDGTAFAWGYNHQGQLGNGDTVDKNYPVRAAAYVYSVDTNGPVMANSYPSGGTCALSTTLEIKVIFDENIKQGDIFNSISFTNSGGAVDFTSFISERMLTIIPNSELLHLSSYTLTIPAGAIKDLSDNPLGTECSITFTTPSEDIVIPN